MTAGPSPRWIPDRVLDHLRAVGDEPDLSSTKYEPIGAIGHGGMATVYAAFDRELEREVAIKISPLPPETSPEAIGRMLREARTLARLEHPGIVPVHDVGTLPDGRAFYVMKLVRGRRLDEHAAELRSDAELLRIVERACEAVAFAHDHGVVHRDLKPQNIMVGAFGEVLVMDWGIAKVGGGSPRPAPSPRDIGTRDSTMDPGVPSPESRSPALVTAAGAILGTPGFMAPEQARGDAGLADERADVYALGAILHALLGARGSAPPRPLRAIIARAMALDPAERYARVVDLAADLAAYREHLPVSAYRERWHERLARVLVRHRTPVLLVLAYLLMRVVLLVWRNG